MTFSNILKMAATVAGYALITGLLWRFFWANKKQPKAKQILIGLIFGACSVAANHFGRS